MIYSKRAGVKYKRTQMDKIVFPEGYIETMWASGEAEWRRNHELCECGDYRYQHENGIGKCKMSDNICHGCQPCLKFRKMEENSKWKY